LISIQASRGRVLRPRLSLEDLGEEACRRDHRSEKAGSIEKKRQSLQYDLETCKIKEKTLKHKREKEKYAACRIHGPPSRKRSVSREESSIERTIATIYQR